MPLNISDIEWIHPDSECRRTWNPITGCLGPFGDGKLCRFCYAKEIADRFKSDFKPTIHHDRMDYPEKAKRPVGIFVGTMSDMFGDWVDLDWLNNVFNACDNAPQHTYFFLTKNPARYSKLDLKSKPADYWPSNWWFGRTAGYMENPLNDLETYIAAPVNDSKVNQFISIEPMKNKVHLGFSVRRFVKWIIVGSENKNGRPVNMPEKEWILDLRRQCKAVKISLFEKNSLASLDLPGGLIQQYPMYGKSKK